MSHYRYLIIGGGVAAGHAAKIFADCGVFPGSVGIVSAESEPPYHRPPLSKDFLRGEKEKAKILVHPKSFYEEQGIDLRLNTSVTAVDFKNHAATLASGEKLSFEKLLIATGARVLTLDLPGEGDSNVHYLRRVEDAEAIMGQSERRRRILVLGSGFIAMEVAASLAQRGNEVTLAFRGKRLLPRLFTARMYDFFHNYYRQKGVSLSPGQTATAFDEHGETVLVRTASGETLETEAVVAGIGVAPNTDLFETSGLKIENGIAVNEYLETNLPDVYAAGDVANYPDQVFGNRRRVEHWQNAVDQGQLAARNMCGAREAYTAIPYFFSDMFDLSWEFWGDNHRAEEVVHVGDFEKGRFSVWWIRDGIVRAAFVMGRDEERELAQRSVQGRAPLPDDIRRKG